MLRTNLFVLTARSNNSGLSQQQKIVVRGLPPNLQPSLIYLKWVGRSGSPAGADDPATPDLFFLFLSCREGNPFPHCTGGKTVHFDPNYVCST